jgi:hypothetical protein
MGKGADGTSAGVGAAEAVSAAAEEHAPRAPSVLDDPTYAPFREQGFNVADFTSRVLAGSHTTAQAQSEQLREGLVVLESELAREVTGRHGELLGNVRRMLDAERSLGDVLLSVESLQNAIRRIRAEVTTPYEHISARTRQLRALHATVDLLRHLTHRLKLTAKLRTQISGVAPNALDLPKTAKLITDIATVDEEVRVVRRMAWCCPMSCWPC